MIKTVRDTPLAGKCVFCRVDFNVPIDNNEIIDDTRIRFALPTLEYLRSEGAKIILATHLGRPKGRVVENLRVAPLGKRLSELMGTDVVVLDQVVGEEVTQAVANLKEGSILLLENVRFDPGEENNDPRLGQFFASLADVFVNDAFGTAHRAHASTEGVGHYLPGVSGLLLYRELDVFKEALNHPKRPFTAIIGGAKVRDKIGVIENLLDKVDTLLIGGGLSFTFLHAMGYEVGRSLLEEDKLDVARTIMKKAKEKGVIVHLPQDVVVSKDLSSTEQVRTVSIDSIPIDCAAYDIGSKTIALFSQVIQSSKLVIFNGPMGVCEVPCYSKGTYGVARALAEADATSIVGGGDSIAAIEETGLKENISHISTGGGATLELLEGKVLPGVAVLQEI